MLIQLTAAALNGLVSIIIPALNEEFGIQKTISSIPITEIRNTFGYDVEILVIDITLDADNTYPAEFITQYIKLLNECNTDFITINRFADIEEGAMSITRKVGNKTLALLISLLYSISIKDSQSGMWIMKRNFISKIRLNSDDMSMSEEIKIIAFKFFSSLEIDGAYRKRTGAAKLDIIQHGWKNMKYLFAYKKHLRSALKPLTVSNKEIHLESNLT
jgi:glycosyltransferase involved in cell wall biosynthesis